MKINGGDSIKFGIKWCNHYGRKDLLNKTIKLTPQWFEEDNGLYSYDSCCPGIWNEEDEEADSIYHLFGNNLELIMDCKIIKGNEKDKEDYYKIIEKINNAEAEEMERMANYFLENIN